MRLTRDVFLADRPLPREEITLPAMDGDTVFVRTMNVAEAEAFSIEHARAPERNFQARVAVAGVCDEQGVALFTTDDLPALSALPGQALLPIVEPFLRLNGMRSEDVETPRKNSETATGSDSSTGWLSSEASPTPTSSKP